MKKYYFSIVLFLLVIANSAIAGINSSPFVNVVNGVEAKVGGSGITEQGIAAQFDNPAGLSVQTYKQVDMAYDYMTNDRRIQFLGYGMPLSFGGLSFSVINSGVKDVALYDANNTPNGTGAESNWAFYTAFGSGSGIAHYGIGIGALYKTMLTDKAYGYFVNAGIQSEPLKDLVIGFSMKNAVNTVFWKSNQDEMQRVFIAGASYDLQKYHIKLSANMKKRFYSNTLIGGVSLRYAVLDSFKVYVGYVQKYFNFGISFKKGLIGLSYAYHPDALDMAGNHLLQLDFYFGGQGAYTASAQKHKKVVRVNKKNKAQKANTAKKRVVKVVKKAPEPKKEKTVSPPLSRIAQTKKAEQAAIPAKKKETPVVKENKPAAASAAEGSGEILSVKYDNVKLKSKPDFKSANAGVLNKGDMVEVTGTNGKWLKVKDMVNESEGWAFKVFFEKAE